MKKSKWTIDSYRLAVDGYRNAGSKEEKHDMERLINDIKSDFRSEISGNDPKLKKLYKLNGELANLTTQTTLFEMSKKEKSAWTKKVEALTKETKKLETEINEIRDNQIYENAFEWRFEFPEVLNDAGDFTGFDVVIGNPPYLSGASFREFHNFFNTRFEVAEYQLDLYTFFIELSNLILRPNAYLAFITPSSWLKNIKMGKTRKYFLNNFQAISINPNISKAFEEAQVDTLIVLSHKTSMVSSLDTTTSIWSFNNENQVEVKHKINQEYFRGNQSFVFDVEVNSKQRKLIKKIRNLSTNLDSIFEITRGVNPYDKYRGQSQEIIKSKAYHSQTKKDDTFTPELRGKHVSFLQHKWDGKHFISYGNWLAAPRDPKFFKGERILFREIISDRFVLTYIDENIVVDRSLYIAKPKFNTQNLTKSIVGQLSSKLLIWLFRLEKNEFDDLFPKIRLTEFKELPIKHVHSDQESDEIGQIVNQILDLKKADPKADTSALEAQIDQLVYALYGLTDEEIAIVEGAVG